MTIVKPSDSSSSYHHHLAHNQQASSSSIYDLIVNQNEMILASSTNTNSSEHGMGDATSCMSISSSPTNSPNSNSSSHNSSGQFSNGHLKLPQQLTSQASTNGLVYSSPSTLASSEPSDFMLNNQSTNSKISNTYVGINTILPGINGVMSAVGSTGLSAGRFNRSNSVSSVNTVSDTNLTNAEQKRRCNIQHGLVNGIFSQRKFILFAKILLNFKNMFLT